MPMVFSLLIALTTKGKGEGKTKDGGKFAKEKCKTKNKAGKDEPPVANADVGVVRFYCTSGNRERDCRTRLGDVGSGKLAQGNQPQPQASLLDDEQARYEPSCLLSLLDETERLTCPLRSESIRVIARVLVSILRTGRWRVLRRGTRGRHVEPV